LLPYQGLGMGLQTASVHLADSHCWKLPNFWLDLLVSISQVLQMAHHQAANDLNWHRWSIGAGLTAIPSLIDHIPIPRPWNGSAAMD
jgi:hypothetical protein